MKQSYKATAFYYDRLIIYAVVALLVFGLLMVASSSMVISDRQYGYPSHYLVRQSIYITMGLVSAFVVTRIPIERWQQFSGYLIVIAIILLMLVLVPGIGRMVNGSRRWIRLGGLTVQVSELAKLFVVLYMARFLSRFQDQVRNQWSGFLKPMLLIFAIGFLLLLEPDFGTAAVLLITCLLMLFLAGVRLTPFVILFALVVCVLGVLAVVSPYRLARLTTFLNPWHSPYGAGYQLTQSLIAFGRGGVFGVGLGNSIQKLFYLPEAHTDFLFAVIAEELGLVGQILVIALLGLFIYRVFVLAQKASDRCWYFQAYFAYGMAVWVALQAMINIGVNTGLLPTKGITLPFLSYGGSSMLVNCILVGIVLRLSHELYCKQGDEARADAVYIRRFL